MLCDLLSFLGAYAVTSCWTVCLSLFAVNLTSKFAELNLLAGKGKAEESCNGLHMQKRMTQNPMSHVGQKRTCIV